MFSLIQQKQKQNVWNCHAKTQHATPITLEESQLPGVWESIFKSSKSAGWSVGQDLRPSQVSSQSITWFSAVCDLTQPPTPPPSPLDSVYMPGQWNVSTKDATVNICVCVYDSLPA